MANINTKLQSRVNGFVTGRKNSGKNGLALFNDCLKHMLDESGDWTPLAWLLHKLEQGEKARMNRIFNAVTINYKIRIDRKQPTGFRIEKTGNYGTTDKFEILEKLVKENKNSFMGVEVSAQILDIKKETPDFDLDKKAKTIAVWMLKEKISPEMLANSIKMAQGQAVMAQQEKQAKDDMRLNKAKALVAKFA